VPDAPLDWESWLAAHGPAAQLYARQFAASAEDAEDALHDGFLRFWPRRQQARDPLAFFYACVRSAALDRRRRDTRRHKRDLAAAPRDVAPGPGLAQREAIAAALAQLPEPQREAVVLKIWAGLTFQQMADATGESINTLSARYRYAMEKLEGLLSPELRHER
jgi:RNA polymerase sigma-70 factor (ECF subfamily)